MKIDHYYKMKDETIVYIEHYEDKWVRAIEIYPNPTNKFIVTYNPDWIELSDYEAAKILLL